YVVSKPILLYRIVGAGGAGHHPPGPPGKVGDYSVQLVNVFAEGAEAVDTSADFEKPAADALARAAPGSAGRIVCEAIPHSERTAQYADRVGAIGCHAS